MARRQYALQGWRKHKIYPDFIFTLDHNGGKERIMILGTKGNHLDSPDTRYKQEVLKAYTDAFRFEDVTGRGEWRYLIRAGS